MFVFVVFSTIHDLTFYHSCINKKFSQKEEKKQEEKKNKRKRNKEEKRKEKKKRGIYSPVRFGNWCL